MTAKDFPIGEDALQAFIDDRLEGDRRAAVEAHLAARDLPRHPLVEDGYLSIGCMPCTDRVPVGGNARDGRWAGLDKTECGIHLGEVDGSGI